MPKSHPLQLDRDRVAAAHSLKSAIRTPPETVTRLAVRKADYYEVLGIEPGASPEEVKRAYRERAKSTHPDASRTSDTVAEFMKIKEVRLVWMRGWPAGRSI